jgi:hypothetical protein
MGTARYYDVTVSLNTYAINLSSGRQLGRTNKDTRKK